MRFRAVSARFCRGVSCVFAYLAAFPPVGSGSAVGRGRLAGARDRRRSRGIAQAASHPSPSRPPSARPVRVVEAAEGAGAAAGRAAPQSEHGDDAPVVVDVSRRGRRGAHVVLQLQRLASCSNVSWWGCGGDVASNPFVFVNRELCLRGPLPPQRCRPARVRCPPDFYCAEDDRCRPVPCLCIPGGAKERGVALHLPATSAGGVPPRCGTDPLHRIVERAPPEDRPRFRDWLRVHGATRDWAAAAPRRPTARMKRKVFWMHVPKVRVHAAPPHQEARDQQARGRDASGRRGAA